MSNVAKRQNKMIQEKNGIIQDKDGVIIKMKSKLKIFNKIKKTQEKFKSDKNFIADCSYCDKKKGQLTNAHNYMEHMMYKHLLWSSFVHVICDDILLLPMGNYSLIKLLNLFAKLLNFGCKYNKRITIQCVCVFF